MVATKKKQTKTKKKPTKKRKEKNIPNSITERSILIVSILGFILAITMIIYNRCDRTTPSETPQKCHCKDATAPIKSKTTFDDINSEQLAHAQANGLKYIIQNKTQFKKQIDSLKQNKILVEIRPNKYYNIRPLTHSFPFLIPEAKNLLDTIGKRFQANLQQENLPTYKFQISSLLRTVEYQQQLVKHNPNATQNLSAHYYGTTFDIAYDQYDRKDNSYQDTKVEKVLEKTLQELRNECKLMIKRETSNKCYHITVVKIKE